MSNILTGFNMQGNDPIDDRIVSKSNLETLEQYLNRVPVQKRYYGLTFFALDKNNELRKYTFQTSLIEPTIDDNEEEIERIDKELQEHVSDKAIHKTSEEIRSEIVDADIPDTIARVQWTLDQINTAVINLIGGASDEYNTLKRIQTKIEELRAKIYGDDGGTVLKTLEQALKFLNQYKDFIVDIPENFVNKQDIVDNLTTDDPTKVLSAKQGKVLSDTLTNYFESAMQSIRTETDRAINAENRIETKLDKEIDRSIKEDQRIDSKLDAEIERSTNEDIRIDTKLDSEINRSTAEDNRLDEKIDAETTRATEAESNLNTKIETETDRAESEESRIETKLDNEITRSTNKDTEHDNRLQALEGQTHEQNTDLGTTNSTFQLKYNTGNKIKHESDAISVRNAADTDYVNFIAKNATFKGDLLVEGQSFVTEAETVEIKDNLLLLNKGEVGAGVTKGIAGLEIDRGTEPNYFIIFDESDNRFKAGVEGDLWNLALRESDDNMLDGYFISWNSKNKILSTTNIVNESTPLLFGRTDYKRYSGNKIYQEGVYSSYSFIDETPRGFLYNSAGDNDWNIDTSKLNFRFWKPILGTTFRRKSDNSEVLYHADIVNNLTSGGTNKVLSAEQGKILQNSITSIQGSYLPLSGGTMTGSIRFPVGLGIVCEDVSGSAAYGVLRTWNYNDSTRMYVGTVNFPTYISSTASDLIHDRNGSSYLLWDSYNLPTPASTTDLANYLPLIGGTLTGQLTIKQSVDIKLRLQSTDADNHCIIQAIDSQASQLGVFGYAGDKWVIGHNGTYYEIWDKYNLTNPVTYTTNTYNHATLTNKDGQYFTYIKAGTNGLLPHSKAALVSGGSGSLGTSDQSFNAAYINNLHTNKVTFGDAGSFIDNQSGDSDHKGIGFYTSQNAACPVYVGSLCVSDSYAYGAPNIPANGIYSKGIIYIENGIGFRNSIWTNDLTPNRNYSGYLQVLDAYDASSAGGPTNYGTVLQVNSRNSHWANQLWFPGGAKASKNGLYYRHMAYNETTYGEWNKLLTNKDVNILATSYNNNPNSLPTNQIFYAETQGVAGTPTSSGLLFSVQGDDEGIQLWAGANRTELYYRTKWTSFGNWIKLATTSDIGNYLPLSGGTISSSKSNPLTINSTHASQSSIDFSIGGVNKGTVGFYESLGSFLQNVTGETLAVKSDGAYYGANTDSLRKLATVTDLNNYLPLTGGNLTGKLWIKAAGSNLLILDSSSSTESAIHFLRSSISKGAVGYYDNIGAFIYNFPSNTYLSIKDDGKPYIRTGANSTRIALITDIPTVSGYLPLSGGTMTGALTMNSRKNNAVIDVVGGTGNNWNGGAGALSVQVPSDGGQTPLLLARRSGATINTTTLSERLLDMALLDTGTIFRVGMSGVNALELEVTSFTNKVGIGKLFGKQIATTDQIPSIPSISISNSGSGNAVTAISASGHTLTVTKGATYLTSSSLSGYATQSWANGQFASLSLYNTTRGYSTIRTTGNEFCLGNTAATSASNQMLVNYRIPSGCTYAPASWVWRAGSSTSYADGYWGNLYMNDNLVATQSWASGQFPTKTGTGASGTWGISISGNATTATTASKLGSTTIGGSAKPIYLSSGTPTACSATVGSTTVPVYMNAGTITQCSTTLGVSITGNAATATNSTQLGGTAASSYVKANDNISRLTNDSGYTTQEWVNGQGFLTSDSLLDKFVPTTGGYIRNSDQVLLRIQRTGVSTGTSRTIEMYFDDSNTDGTSTTPRGSIGYNSEVGMFLYSAASKKFLAMEYTGRPFYGTPENRYYLLGSNTQYHNPDGYQRIGDIMIQWGYFTVQGNSTRAVNFPVSFTSTVWSVTGSWDNTTTGNQENWGFSNYTSSGFTIINGDGDSRVFHYIAIGPFTRS